MSCTECGQIDECMEAGKCLLEGRSESSISSTDLLACTDAMLEVAVAQAIRNGLLLAHGFGNEVGLDGWERLRECINAALQANIPANVPEERK